MAYAFGESLVSYLPTFVTNLFTNTYNTDFVELSEINSIDLQSVPKLISKPLKEKIKYEAQDLNFLKKTSRAKLIF